MIGFWPEFWAWLRKWGLWVLGGLAVLVGAGWLWGRRRELGRIRDELTVARARRDIDRLRGARDEVVRQLGEQDEAIIEIDAKLRASERAIVEAHENGRGLTDEQVADEFRRLGY